jgi:hypothetical protein
MAKTIALYEDQLRDNNYDRSECDMERGGGEGGSLNLPDMINQIKAPIIEAQEMREREDERYG